MNEEQLKPRVLELLKNSANGLTQGDVSKKAGVAWHRGLARSHGVDVAGKKTCPVEFVKDFLYDLWFEGSLVLEPPKGRRNTPRYWAPSLIASKLGYSKTAGGGAKPMPPPLPPPSAGGGIPSRIQAAYRKLSSERGLSFIPISALHERSQVPLADLHNWLAESAKTGVAELSIGDWASADEGERAAVLERGGRRFLLAKVVSNHA